MGRWFRVGVWCLLAWAAAGVTAAWGAEYHGRVTFGGVPVPGVTVRASSGGRTVLAVSDVRGIYSFADLADGVWAMQVEMTCFATIQQEVTVGAAGKPVDWELTLLPVAEILAQTKAVRVVSRPVLSAASPAAPETPRPPEETAARASDGLLINGSSNNAAASAFSLAGAFGNSRTGSKGLYTGGLAVIVDNSAFDARPYSLTGLETAKASYNRVTAGFQVGGPVRIPHVLPRGPNFFVAYQWTRDRNATTDSALVPDAAERGGDLSGALDALGQPLVIVNPATGLPFAGNRVPVSAQAAALLALYPLPNLAGSTRYNYQTPILSSEHQDALQMRLDKSLGRRDQVFGGFASQSVRTGGANLFGFLDTTDVLGMNANANWGHRFQHGLFLNSGFRFSRIRTQVKPYFANRVDVSGAAGIGGNDREAREWGPPGLQFSSGIAALSDVQSALNRNETNGVAESVQWIHRQHTVTAGGDFRRQEFNYLSQQDPRGTFVFTGAATAGAGSAGSDLADFLLGVPDTSSIAYGNADKYLRQGVYDAYATDDWRVRPDLTLNVGLRYEYGAPITERMGRLVNLDVGPGFGAVQPVLATSAMGGLTGFGYGPSLIRPDRLGIEPRIGVSWRPIPASTMVVRAGYGVYDDTSVYQQTALNLAQQAPLSKSVRVANSAGCPLTLANGFNNCAGVTADTFAVDPRFRVGYAQTWQLSVQRDLPGALVMTATYLGIKGTRGVQEFLPNTYPAGAVNPCPACATGYVYRASNGNSTRESGQVQVRRRLRSGFTATALYTYSKSIDDDAVLGGQGPVAAGATATPVVGTAAVAQDWLNLRGERGLSTFDQRHLLSLQMQYTTGMGIGGRSLMSGWRGTLFKEWTVVTNLVAGSGLPETPIYLQAVAGTGVTGSVRPDATGASLYSAGAGRFLNPAAYAAPRTGQWGTAGRDSIIGPGPLTLNGSASRTFRLEGRYNLDVRVDATNLLNHAVFTSWNSTVNSTTFGLPVAANAMRSLQTTMRLRF